MIWSKIAKKSWIGHYLHYHCYLVFLLSNKFYLLNCFRMSIHFVYSNRLQLVSSNFWCNHNPEKILQHNFHLDLLLNFLLLCIVLHQNKWGSPGSSVARNVTILDNTFRKIINLSFIPSRTLALLWIMQQK